MPKLMNDSIRRTLIYLPTPIFMIKTYSQGL